jgi:hypothetical protein
MTFERYTVPKKSQASRTSAWERRNWAQVLDVRWGAGVDARVGKDLPHGGGGELHAEDEEFAVNAAVAPARVLLRQSQDQQTDRAYAWRPIDKHPDDAVTIPATMPSRCCLQAPRR